MAIKFTNDKVDRWVGRIGKRQSKLTPEDLQNFTAIRDMRLKDVKLDSHWEKILLELERKV